ncbi:MAG: hypothetical protein JRG94_15890 [Deltaproteobacteria bacterium]|nr:hypothetical protein [Deltaproteobacteria bacterium]
MGTSAPSSLDEAESPGLEAAPMDALIPIEAWRDPALEMRPLARWWWPGGSVEARGLRDQLERIKDSGFGAVEVQPLLLGLGASDLTADPRLRTVGLASFRRSIASAATAAAELGLGFDLTLGSGWPGGLPTGKENAERQLLMGTVEIEGPVRFEGPLPPAPDQSYRRAVEWVLDVLGPPDPDALLVAVLAARLGPKRDGVPTLEEVRVITEASVDGRLDWAVPAGRWRILAFYENSTGHFVMGGAFPGEEADALVVDHLSRRGADALLDGYAAPVLDALQPGQVREVFVDSFELMGELPFTRELLETFEARVGYALTPHLPVLFRKGGESKYAEMIDLFGRNGGPLYLASEPGEAARVREDYESVRATLFEERFIERFRRWAHRRDVALRLQAHGGYGDYLDIYARADVPESEALFGGGSFDFLKLAASAAHVAGRRWASSESFITLRLLGTRLSEDEMRLLAGRAYSAGINRLAFHGVPYPYTRADGESWYPFSGGFGRILAGPLPMSSEIDRDFLAQLSDFNRFLSRLTFAMSRGRPAADVAWLRADPIYPDRTSLQLGRIEPHEGESPTTQALRARGLVHDRVSRRMLAGARAAEGTCRIGAGRYRAILLDPIEIAEPELVEAIASIAETGIPVLALGALPHRAPGLRDAKARDHRVRAATKKLSSLVLRVPQLDQLEAILEQKVRSTLVEPIPGSRLAVSIERRRGEAGDTLLVFNESWSPRTTQLRFTRGGGPLTLWDPRSGLQKKLRDRVEAGDVVAVELEAVESLILTLGSPVKALTGTR